MEVTNKDREVQEGTDRDKNKQKILEEYRAKIGIYKKNCGRD